MAWVRACKVEDLNVGEATRLKLTPPVAVYRLEDGFYATADTCTHAQSSLSAGDIDVEDCTVECPYHGSAFDIKTGRALGPPASIPLKTYQVKVEGNEVLVEVE